MYRMNVLQNGMFHLKSAPRISERPLMKLAKLAWQRCSACYARWLQNKKRWIRWWWCACACLRRVICRHSVMLAVNRVTTDDIPFSTAAALSDVKVGSTGEGCWNLTAFSTTATTVLSMTGSVSDEDCLAASRAWPCTLSLSEVTTSQCEQWRGFITPSNWTSWALAGQFE